MRTVPVLGTTMAHRERGDGAPVVFLHGNPTSSHLWREVLPAVDGHRLLAPDLIGMGESGKPDLAYTFADHARHLDAWLDALGLGEVVLVGHDWGGALAFDLAARRPGLVKGVAFTETIVKPMAWEEFPDGGRELFAAIKTPGVGEEMLLDRNLFLDLDGTVAHPLSTVDAEIYRAPFPTRESRVPILQWARSMPLGGDPADVVARAEAYGEWFATTPEVPKLLIAFKPGPGVMMHPEMIAWCEANIAALDVDRHDLVAGHHSPEDQPGAIAASINAWLGRHSL
ncbi:haloalkane dehalogenase [Phytomonospora endophytica]|uniref:Haloalkane dehalogenase n=1 Tax=Phytomonospora endophytica TaxID=714109 RepID=A0A841FM67_9ACTN|nr:haloalkane dehalogenase [Phytomonospora endophytica]MBB6034632.1 haloalkane dehalogenase [Phytomonospora endophytica]GIG71308.1 haloalkane dehalogenase [Phytomonospora endophytica]